VHLCITWRAHVWLFTLFVQGLFGGMSASIALLNEHDNVSYVFTPYSFIFICIRHMIGKIGEKWQRAMTWLSMAEKATHWSKNVQSIAVIRTKFQLDLDRWYWQLIGVQDFPFTTCASSFVRINQGMFSLQCPQGCFRRTGWQSR
jgi:hypothetical protein